MTVKVAEVLWRTARSVGVKSLGRKIASHWPFPILVSIENGREMYVDLRSSIGRGLFATGKFDMEAIAPALGALRDGATFIDIGSNIGFYSILALDRVGAAGCVICFEIDPRPLRVLRKTVARIGLRNIEIIEAAVCDTDGITKFIAAPDTGHSRINCAIGGAGRPVRSVRLDSWIAERGLRRIDVIKIDVEGSEKSVLEGAHQTILRFKPLILCEAAAENTMAFGYRPQDLISLLCSFGYTATWLTGVCTPVLLAKPT